MTDQEKLASGQYELAREGDLYALRRRLEEQQVLQEPEQAEEDSVAESSLVPGALDMQSEIDITGGPRPRTPRYLPDLTTHRVNEYSLADFEDAPGELMTRQQWSEFRTQVQNGARTLISLGDFDHCLQMAQMQLADALCHAAEYCKDSVERFGQELAAQIQQAKRDFDGSEVRQWAIRELENKKRMAAIRYMFFNNMLRAFLDEREHQQRLCPFDYHAYRSNAAMRKARFRREAASKMSAEWAGLSETQYRKKLAQLGSYTPRGDGVDADRDVARTTAPDQQQLRTSQRGGR